MRTLKFTLITILISPLLFVVSFAYILFLMLSYLFKMICDICDHIINK